LVAKIAPKNAIDLIFSDVSRALESHEWHETKGFKMSFSCDIIKKRFALLFACRFNIYIQHKKIRKSPSVHNPKMEKQKVNENMSTSSNEEKWLHLTGLVLD